jgi:hypothetical protein
MTDPESILLEYGQFDEAVIEQMRFVGSTLQLEIVLDATQSTSVDGPSTGQDALVRLLVSGVEEVHVRNHAPWARLDDDLIGWSQMEIALAEFDADDLPPPQTGTRWISFLWENDQRIDVRFHDISAERLPPEPAAGR